MLPAAIPRACLMLYNWPAKFYTNAVDLTLHDLAEGLWLDIHARRCQRREPVYRPILFIASCFGGLVNAKALHSAASKTRTYSYLRDATVGIVFLGTPFNGTPMQRQAQWLIAYGNLRREDTSRALVENLAAEETNAHLKELVDNFAISVNSTNFSILIHCFYETQKTNLAKKALPPSLAKYMPYNRFIVDKNSASLRGFQSTYLNCTHVMMNKFAPGTNEYDRGRNVVVGFVENSRNVLAIRSPAYDGIVLLDDLVQWALKCQPLLDWRSELETRHSFASPVPPDHLTWFTHTSPYVSWYRELRGVLWHRSEIGDQSSPLIYVANRIEAACTNLKALYVSGLDAQITEVSKTPSNANPNQVIQTLLARYFHIVENDVSGLRRSLNILIDNSNDLDDLKKMMATGWMSPSLDVSRALRQLLFLPRDTKLCLSLTTRTP